MSGENSDCLTMAQCYCVEQYDWLLLECHRAIRRSHSPNISIEGQDLVHDVYCICAKISDAQWTEIDDHKAYLAQIAINKIKALFSVSQEIATETDKLVIGRAEQPQTPEQAMQAAILVQELYDKLTDEEQKLLDLVFDRYTFEEIGARLGISSVAARKRFSRLIQKLKGFLNKGTPPIPKLSTLLGNTNEEVA